MASQLASQEGAGDMGVASGAERLQCCVAVACQPLQRLESGPYFGGWGRGWGYRLEVSVDIEMWYRRQMNGASWETIDLGMGYAMPMEEVWQVSVRGR